MKFLCAVYVEPATMEALSAQEHVELNRDSLAHDQELVRSGHFIAASALQHTSTARTVRVRRGQLNTLDGPFAETKEILGGFIFIEARDMDEAVQIASKIPMAKYGTIEVRPEMKISKPV